jgi:hypothetical protein
MNWKVIWSSLFISLYLQGLSLYFHLTGATGSRTSSLTGTFLLTCLCLFLIISFNIKEAREKLLRFDLLEILCLCFFGIFLYDFINNPVYLHLPKNIFFQFCVYTFSLFVARGMTFKHFKWCFYFTTFLAVFTSLLLLGDFLGGHAASVAYGSRLTSGDSANPIETGHMASYAASASLLLSVLSNSLGMKLFFLIVGIPGALIAILSGTRSAVISLSISVVIIMVTTLLLNLRGSTSFLKRLSISSILYYTVVFLSALFIPVLSSYSSGFQSQSDGKKGFELNGTINRLSNILVAGDSATADQSVQERYSLYDKSIEMLTENPLVGGKLYSAGFVHNAFLQTATEYGILGIVTYTLPFVWLTYHLANVIRLGLKQGADYFKTDAWMITLFTTLLFVQAIMIMLFHSDPYRSYFTPAVIGLMIAFSRLGLDSQLKHIKSPK